MKVLYIDCGMGAAGDMLTAALLELVPDREGFLRRINGLGIPGVTVEAEKKLKSGITGTHITVKIDGEEEWEHEHEHDHEHEHEHAHAHDHEHDHRHEHDHEHGHAHHHHHTGMSDIRRIVYGMDISEKVKGDILAVYNIIAEAESHVHSEPVEQIHFHEVGDKDAIADITAVCLLMDELRPDEIIASPVCTGSGHVHCAHGIMPVPAPATAYILRGVPSYSGRISSELCTPTGAALIKHFVGKYGEMPVMRTEAVGYGMGKKDFDQVNCVRAMIGEAEDRTDVVLELSANVDDMTAEAVGFAMDRLFEAGALEVFTVPVGMKKSRPGILIKVMCREDDREKMLQLIFKHTSTIGVREVMTRRFILDRRIEEYDTPYGKVHIKKTAGYGVSRLKCEYDDIAEIARKEGMGMKEAEKKVLAHIGLE
jgi:uncharacterized protein (TIGR00299 family) protein